MEHDWTIQLIQNRLTSLEIKINQLEKKVEFLNELIALQIKVNDATIDTLETMDYIPEISVKKTDVINAVKKKLDQMFSKPSANE